MVTVNEMMANIIANLKVVGEKTVKCAKHGDYTATITADGKVSACPHCKAEKEAEKIAKATEENNQRLMKKIGKCGIPKRHQHCRVSTYQADTPKQQTLKAEITAYAKEMISGSLKRNFVMLGNCGTGKTHLACAVGMEAVKQGQSVLFATASEIIRRVQAAHKSQTETEWELMNTFADLDLLIIDEVGVQYATESANRIITEIVNARYNNEKPTIFISNLSPAEFQAVMGERAMSRMREDGCKPFVCDWQDYRISGEVQKQAA